MRNWRSKICCRFMKRALASLVLPTVKGDFTPMLTAVDDFFRRSITTLLTIYLVAGIAVIVALVSIIRALVRTYVKYRGNRLVVCPETERYETVEIDGP